MVLYEFVSVFCVYVFVLCSMHMADMIRPYVSSPPNQQKLIYTACTLLERACFVCLATRTAIINQIREKVRIVRTLLLLLCCSVARAHTFSVFLTSY